ncbi:MAG: tetratricopeptide repeat protein, partial [Burkholderiales bacterium]
RWQAIEQCRRIEELAPDYGDITFNLGQLYLTERQPSEALTYLQRAVEINPYSAAKRFALGAALAELGQPNGAREQLRAALRLSPAHRDAAALLAELDRATR